MKDTSVSLGVKVVGKLDLEKLQANRPREVKHNVNTGIDKNGTFVGKIDAKRIYVWAGGKPYYIDKKGKGSSSAGVQMNVTMTRMRKYTSKRRKDRIIKQEAFSTML